ncbi:hypothetical protein COO60DRAFT_415329 [Scenedesmus sp. NREL 46B-D3]|nr:hypothetical protein COO60DRAFT_415329 [Scenedesmus sp. NREL 46B-D3]
MTPTQQQPRSLAADLATMPVMVSVWCGVQITTCSARQPLPLLALHHPCSQLLLLQRRCTPQLQLLLNQHTNRLRLHNLINHHPGLQSLLPASMRMPNTPRCWSAAPCQSAPIQLHSARPTANDRQSRQMHTRRPFNKTHRRASTRYSTLHPTGFTAVASLGTTTAPHSFSPQHTLHACCTGPCPSAVCCMTWQHLTLAHGCCAKFELCQAAALLRLYRRSASPHCAAAAAPADPSIFSLNLLHCCSSSHAHMSFTSMLTALLLLLLLSSSPQACCIAAAPAARTRISPRCSLHCCCWACQSCSSLLHCCSRSQPHMSLHHCWLRCCCSCFQTLLKPAAPLQSAMYQLPAQLPTLLFQAQSDWPISSCCALDSKGRIKLLI